MIYEATRPLYREGRIIDVGEAVNIDDDQDRKAMIARGTIAERKVEQKPANKMAPAPENKAKA